MLANLFKRPRMASRASSSVPECIFHRSQVRKVHVAYKRIWELHIQGICYPRDFVDLAPLNNCIQMISFRKCSRASSVTLPFQSREEGPPHHGGVFWEMLIACHGIGLRWRATAWQGLRLPPWHLHRGVPSPDRGVVPRWHRPLPRRCQSAKMLHSHAKIGFVFNA